MLFVFLHLSYLLNSYSLQSNMNYFLLFLLSYNLTGLPLSRVGYVAKLAGKAVYWCWKWEGVGEPTCEWEVKAQSWRGGREGGGRYWHCLLGKRSVFRVVVLAEEFCAAATMSGGDSAVVESECGVLENLGSMRCCITYCGSAAELW